MMPARRPMPDADVTRILQAIDAGNAKAASELLPLVYDELRKLAGQRMRNESPDQTLDPTALVHEAYIRLVGKDDPGWQNRGHFFAAAAEAMRRILIDNSRRKKAARHGGHLDRVDADAIDIAVESGEEQLLAIHEALDRLAAYDPVKAELVKLRYFVGLTIQQTAEVLGISEPTAKRYWTYARAWLYREIKGHDG